MLYFINNILYRYLFYIFTLFLIIIYFVNKEPSYWGIIAISCIILGNIIFLYQKKTLVVNAFDIFLMFLIFYEKLNILNSVYDLNSELFYLNFIIGISILYLINHLFIAKNSDNKKLYFIVFFSLFLTVLGIITYFLKFSIVSQYGFSNFLQFRNLYLPLGIGANEWGTILLFIFIFIYILFVKCVNNVFLYEFSSISIIGVLILVLINISLTSSRGVNISILFFLISILFFTFLKKVEVRKTIIITNILFIVFFISLNKYNQYINSKQQDKNEISYSYIRSISGRLKQWKQLPNINKDFPLWGVGSNNYALINVQYHPYDKEYTYTGRINNTIFQLIIEKGWVGFLVYTSFFMIFIYLSIKKYKHQSAKDKIMSFTIFVAVLTILVRELFFSSIFYNTSILILFLTLICLNCNLSIRYKFNNNIAVIVRILFILVLSFYCYEIYNNIKKRKIYSEFIYYFENQNYNNAKLILSQLPQAYKNFYDILIKERVLVNDCNTLNKSCNAIFNTRLNSSYKIIQNPYLFENKYNYCNDLYNHNIAWLYFFQKDYHNSLKYINEALLQNPNIALYYLSKGIFLERDNVGNAFLEYEKALILSPDILWSDFFDHLTTKYPQKVKSLLANIEQKLKLEMKFHYSPIVASKIGCFLLYNKKIDESFKVFKQVTESLPNLSRPWFYLAVIYQYKRMDLCAVNCLKKTIFLDPTDYLAYNALSDYYKSVNDFKNMDFYFSRAKINYGSMYSDHYLKSFRTYNIYSAKNEIIPQGLLKYVKPQYNILTLQLLN